MAARRSRENSHAGNCMQTPTVEKPYGCIVCGERFQKIVCLKNHLVKHEGSDPFECHVCSQRFDSSRDLRLHMNIHTGEKLYSHKVSNSDGLVKTESEVDSYGVIKTESKVEVFGIFQTECIETNGPMEMMTVHTEQIKKEEEDYEQSKPVTALHTQQAVCKVEVPPHMQCCTLERSSSLDQEDPEPRQIKEEPEELLTSQEEKQLQGLEKAAITGSSLTVICVKSDSGEDQNQFSDLPLIQTNPHISDESSSTQRNAANSTGPLITVINHQTNESAEDTKRKPYNCSICGKGFRVKRVRELVKHARTHMEKKSYRCILCCKQFSSISKLTTHIKEHLGQRLHVCNICDAKFTQSENLQQHMEVHNRVHPYTCSICERGFPTTTRLKLHMRTHSGERPYSCGVCGKTFNYKQSLRVHERMHTGERLYQCSMCERNYSKKQGLTRHMRSHTGEKPYGCSICGKRFTQPGSRNIHMMRLHTGERPHKCAVCGTGFTVKRELDHHISAHAAESADITSAERVKPEADAEGDALLKTDSVEEVKTECIETNGPMEMMTVHTEQIKKEEEDYELSKPVTAFHTQQAVCKVEVPPHMQCCTLERSSSLDQEDPEPRQIKEEPEELLTSQEEKQLQGLEKAAITDSSLTVICVKSDSGEDQNQSSDLPLIQTNPHISDESSSTQRNVANSTGPLITVINHQTNESAEDTKRKPYNCSICGKGFRVKRVRELEKHARTHMEKKLYRCIVCCKKFSSISKLTTHIKEHLGQRLHVCNICDAKFTESENLKQHMEVHNRVHPYTCSICERGFPTTTRLKLHMRMHSGERPYSCGVCGKTFNYKQSLRVHERMHTGERLYQCSMCERNYSKKQGLTRHMRSHTGEKPYGCSICGKRFTQPGSRNIHMMRLHTGERPHKCAICGTGFTVKRELDHHISAHAAESADITSAERVKPEADAEGDALLKTGSVEVKTEVLEAGQIKQEQEHL